jgi:SnoaL-like domain
MEDWFTWKILWSNKSKICCNKKMTPKDVVIKWVDTFNKADAAGVANLYGDTAINHQVNTFPLEGKDAIQKMFDEEFAKANMVCIIENIFEDGEWAILEWKDPLGLRGCGFFHIINDKIIFQRGYWEVNFFEATRIGDTRIGILGLVILRC